MSRAAVDAQKTFAFAQEATRRSSDRGWKMSQRSSAQPVMRTVRGRWPPKKQTKLAASSAASAAAKTPRRSNHVGATAYSK